MSPEVSCITVKDKAKHWEPLPEDTYPLIYAGVRKALGDYESKTAFPTLDRYVCKLNLTEDHFFDAPDDFPWKGTFDGRSAQWEAHDIITALSLFWQVHNYIRKQ